MKKYKEQSAGAIEWRDQNGESVTIGLVIEGQTHTRTNENGDEETYSPWDELLDSGAEIEWITDEQKAATEREQKRAQLKAQLNETLQSLSYTTASGAEIQTRPQDQVLVQIGIETGETEWVCKDNKVHEVKKADLEKALKEGIKNAKKAWHEYKQEIKKL